MEAGGEPGRDRPVEHAQANAVLHTAAWIKGLQLHQHFGPIVLRKSVQANDRSVTDDLADIIVNSIVHTVFRDFTRCGSIRENTTRKCTFRFKGEGGGGPASLAAEACSPYR